MVSDEVGGYHGRAEPGPLGEGGQESWVHASEQYVAGSVRLGWVGVGGWGLFCCLMAHPP